MVSRAAIIVEQLGLPADQYVARAQDLGLGLGYVILVPHLWFDRLTQDLVFPGPCSDFVGSDADQGLAMPLEPGHARILLEPSVPPEHAWELRWTPVRLSYFTEDLSNQAQFVLNATTDAAPIISAKNGNIPKDDHEQSTPMYRQRHPNVDGVLACIDIDGNHLLLHRYYRHTLSDIAAFSARAAQNCLIRCTFMVYQMCHALLAAHCKDLIHGAIHPECLHVDDNFNVIVTGFLAGTTPQAVVHSPTRRLTSVTAFHDFSDIMDSWLYGSISNYQYLIVLNFMAGRRRGNPAHHPIMPWVIDFERANGNYRDLQKSKHRLQKGDEQLDLAYRTGLRHADPMKPAHHIVEPLSDLGYYTYLARRLPRAVLQRNVRKQWEPKEYPATIQRVYESAPDECIPEFFDDPTVFKSTHPDMGDLGIPSWAVSPEDFCDKHLRALESDEVSRNLHYWIDLNFGCLLSGKKSVENKNVASTIVDDHNLLKNHGFTELFTTSHPPRLIDVPDTLGRPLQRALHAFASDTQIHNETSLSGTPRMNTKFPRKNRSEEFSTPVASQDAPRVLSMLAQVSHLEDTRAFALSASISDVDETPVPSNANLQGEEAEIAKLRPPHYSRRLQMGFDMTMLGCVAAHLMLASSKQEASQSVGKRYIYTLRKLASDDTTLEDQTRIARFFAQVIMLLPHHLQDPLQKLLMASEEARHSEVFSAGALMVNSLSELPPYMPSYHAFITACNLAPDHALPAICADMANQVLGMQSEDPLTLIVPYYCTAIKVIEHDEHKLMHLLTILSNMLEPEFLSKYLRAALERKFESSPNLMMSWPMHNVIISCLGFNSYLEGFTHYTYENVCNPDPNVAKEACAVFTETLRFCGPYVGATRLLHPALLYWTSFVSGQSTQRHPLDPQSPRALNRASLMDTLHFMDACISAATSLYGDALLVRVLLPFLQSVTTTMVSSNGSPQREKQVTLLLMLMTWNMSSMSYRTLRDEGNWICDSIILPCLSVASDVNTIKNPGTRRSLLRAIIDFICSIDEQVGAELSRRQLMPLFAVYFSTVAGLYERDFEGSPNQKQSSMASRAAVQVYSPAQAEYAYQRFVEMYGENAFTTEIAGAQLVLHVIEVNLSMTSRASTAQKAYEVEWADDQEVPEDIVLPDDADMAKRGSTSGIMSAVRAVQSMQATKARRREILRNLDLAKIGLSDSVQLYLKLHLVDTMTDRGRMDPARQGFQFKELKIQSLKCHYGPIRSIAVSENERSFMTAGRDKTVKLWSLKHDEEAYYNSRTYNGHSKPLLGCTFFDARGDLAASNDGMLHIWSVETGHCKATMSGPRGSNYTCMATVSPHCLVAGASNGLITILDSRENQSHGSQASTFGAFHRRMMRCGPSLSGAIRSIDYTKDREQIAVGYASGAIAILDMRGGKVIGNWKAHDSEIMQIEFLDSLHVVARTADSALTFWSLQMPSQAHELMLWRSNTAGDAMNYFQRYKTSVFSLLSGNRLAVHSSVMMDNHHLPLKQRLGPQTDTKTQAVALHPSTLKGMGTCFRIMPIHQQLVFGSDTGIVSICA